MRQITTLSRIGVSVSQSPWIGWTNHQQFANLEEAKLLMPMQPMILFQWFYGRGSTNREYLSFKK
jgi:hypothetical protein